MKLEEIRKLHQKKYRAQFGHFLVEGEHLLQELEKASGREPALRDSLLLVTENYLDWPSTLAKTVVTDKQMSQLSDTKSPQGLIAVVSIAAVTGLATQGTAVRTIYLHEVQDPGNLGTILRTLAWFGDFRCLLSPNSVDPFNSKVVRASMGAIFNLPLETDVALESLPERFKRIACLDMQGLPLRDPGFGDFDCYVFGNEARGIPEEARGKLQATAFTIPGKGGIESLNLATAVHLSAYELMR